MDKPRTAIALWAAAAALLLAGGAWLLWGDYLRPHEPVRLVGSPPASAASTPPAQVATPAAPAAPGTEPANPGGAPTAAPAPLPQTANAPANTPAAAAPAATPSDALVAFRRAIEEAQARQATPGVTQPGPRYNSLPEAIEAARQAQLQASAPPAQPAPGAGLNPFSSR